MIVFATVYVSVVFEIVLPHYSTKFTGDLVDVVMYVLGGSIFYWGQKNLRKEQ